MDDYEQEFEGSEIKALMVESIYRNSGQRTTGEIVEELREEQVGEGPGPDLLETEVQVTARELEDKGIIEREETNEGIFEELYTLTLEGMMAFESWAELEPSFETAYHEVNKLLEQGNPARAQNFTENNYPEASAEYRALKEIIEYRTGE